MPLTYIAVHSKDELLSEIDVLWRTQDAFIGGLAAEELRLPVPMDEEATAEWNVGVTVSHMANWKRNGGKVARMHLGRDEPDDRFPPDVLGLDFNQVNAGLVGEWRKRGLDEITSFHRTAHQEFVSAVSELPEHLLLIGEHPVMWTHPGLGHCSHHFKRHVQDPVTARRSA